MAFAYCEADIYEELNAEFGEKEKSMKLELQTEYGSEIQTFIIPDTGEITDKQAIEMGKTIAKTINEIRPKLETYEKKALEVCDCFWKNLSEEERKYKRCHSSECAIWEME